MLHWILVCLIFLGIQQSHAAELPTQDEFDWELSDNPKQTYAWAKAAFLSITPQTAEPLKIRITNFFMASAAMIEDMDLAHQNIQSIEEAWQKAASLSLIQDRLMLGYSLGMYFRLQDDVEKSDRYYQKTIEEARLYHDDNALVQVLVNYGLSLDVGDQKIQSMQYFQEADLLAADESRDIQTLHRKEARLVAAFALEESEAADMDEVIEKSMTYFATTGRRYALASFAFNYARNKISDDVDKALVYLDISLHAARGIQDNSTIGAVLAEQASIANKREQYAEGEKKAAEAARIIGDSDRHWLGRSLAEQAFSLWKLRRFSEGLATINEALGLLSKENVRRYIKALEIRAALQEELGYYRDSVQSHKEIEDSLLKRQYELDTENFAKAKVKLGLQMEEQKNQLLQKENELQAARIKSSRYLLAAAIALGVLLIGAIISTIWAFFNARQIQRAKEKIQIILDVIEEGILTINSKLQPGPEHSRFLMQLYPELFQKQGDVVDWLFPEEAVSSESRSMIRETLRACLGEEILSWNLNSAHLPTEIVLPGPSSRTIHILWQPLLHSDQKIRGFLLSLRDISEQKLLQNEVKIQQRRSQALEARVQEILLTRFQDARRLLETLQKQLNSAAWQDPDFGRSLHTRKGEARTLQLKGLSQAIHRLESAIADGQKEGIELSIEHLRDEILSYLSLMNDVFANRSDTESMPTTLIETVGTLMPALKLQLQEADIAVQLIEVSDAVVNWPEPILDAVRQNLLHALANSADHGYILPGKRGKVPKPAVFRVEAELSAGHIEVRVRDFGAGLDLVRLEELAKAKGFFPGERETVADVVFLDGATTSELTSVTSGRGVGLAAVRELCRRFQGQASLRPNDKGNGSLLVMTFARQGYSISA